MKVPPHLDIPESRIRWDLDAEGQRFGKDPLRLHLRVRPVGQRYVSIHRLEDPSRGDTCSI